ncbi:MAG: hypothetical protein KKE02_20820 [Alphaproteobacteria bacterium]|nr:hypothetical protein [Alphaproteobacteria bacterium]MBU1514522.1 hypothetical protein [Alphaproteobacteria bacterium]MBU2096846.1 hypothetical protein [Alphaproteobacteria bacterium]MBU2153473.1 hypothetical protein [Alphaproteobacteria bacterium]MBU2306022.1 hypothetical protein [Alphaproteobacteria bacterium]
MSDAKPPRDELDPTSPPKRTLLLSTGGALLVAAVIVFAAVLPAEYNQDPLGLGRATGLSRLWAPKEVAVSADAATGPSARREPVAFRSDTFEIPLAADGDEGRRNTLEFKVRLPKGATLVYGWRAEGLQIPEDLMFDFHGHTVAMASGGEVTVADYEKSSGSQANGSLVAPVDGIHGWYFRNRSDRPIKIRLKLSGFYQLVPGGQEGNLAGIQPVAPPSVGLP